MGIFLLLLALLIISALVCGVFFLIFKLIWLMFGSRSNKAPLWLAAGVTLLLTGLAVISVYSKYKRGFLTGKPHLFLYYPRNKSQYRNGQWVFLHKD